MTTYLNMQLKTEELCINLESASFQTITCSFKQVSKHRKRTCSVLKIANNCELNRRLLKQYYEKSDSERVKVISYFDFLLCNIKSEMSDVVDNRILKCMLTVL